MPDSLSAKAWQRVLDTAPDDPFADQEVPAGDSYALQGRSLVVLEEIAAG